MTDAGASDDKNLCDIELDIPDDVYERLEQMAAARGITFNDLVCEVIRDQVAMKAEQDE